MCEADPALIGLLLGRRNAELFVKNRSTTRTISLSYTRLFRERVHCMVEFEDATLQRVKKLWFIEHHSEGWM